MTELTEPQIASIFETWKQRWDENPEWFQSAEDIAAESPKTYGEGAASYFIKLWQEAVGDFE